MAIEGPFQTRYLTTIELVFGYGLFCGMGYIFAGWIGFWCGAGIVTIRYAYLIWYAAYSSAAPNEPGVNRE